ncbi:hypothetical protein ACGFNU_21575 [Spirillospora sp. NPDC048911]|uniref:hypothetical protein n=1 Tax=Spirillospora sp. NPDC048911 TaxID=3364527 RepID=UPI00371FEA1D
MTAAHPLDDLLEEMLPTALELSVVVRDRDTEAVAAVLAPLLQEGDQSRLAALIIDLAVLVPDDTPIRDLTAWTFGPHVPDDVYAQIVELNPRPGMKWCLACEDWHRLEEFHKDSSQRDGRKPRCRKSIAQARLERLAAEGAA